MSIESLLKNLTTAIEENTAAVRQSGGVTTLPTADKAPPPPAAKTETAPPPPNKIVDTGSPTPTESAPPPPVETITGDELNEILRKEFVRIGNTRDPIDKIMQENFNANSLHNLKPENFVELVELVSKIPSV